MAVNRQQQTKVKQIMDFTLLSEKDSLRLLQTNSWNVNAALNSIYEQQKQQRSTPKPNKVSRQRVKAMFDCYKDDQQKNLISVDGTLKLCQDLEIEPTQLEFLLLSHQLNSEKMGEFTEEAFIKGCSELEVDSIDKLKQALQTVLIERYNTKEGFSKIYNYAFLIGRQSGQKNLSLEAAIELWRLLLSGKYSVLEDWIQFLQEKHNKAISRDTWTLFLDFVGQTEQDLQNYDAEGAWPVLIDEFVEYMKEKSQ